MIKVISWNIAKRQQPWRLLAQSDADVALLQEATPPPDDVVRLRGSKLPPSVDTGVLDIGPQETWDSHWWNSDWWRGRWKALYDRWPMVVRLSSRVKVEWFKQVGPTAPIEPDEIAVSGIGTITAAKVTPSVGAIEPFIVVSMYGFWLRTHSSTKSSWIYSDATVHRIISDLSAFIGQEDPLKHRILAAGDLNLMYGYAEGGNTYWARRYQTVFDRMEALGLTFLGPQAPNGRQAHPWPDELPIDSRNVPTYHPTARKPEAATRQLDYVFASKGFADTISVRALNSPEEWGPSDHCRIEILVS